VIAFVDDDSASVVSRALEGFALAHADAVDVHTDPLVVVGKHRSPARQVGLVSGGGSGHEPLHAGFIGTGMLDAVAPGQVFASPHNRAIYRASQLAAGPAGVLHIVKNYTGDLINFGIAEERLAADKISVARVVVDDDIATDSADIGVGRRGTGATVLVEKIVGSAADDGWALDELAALGRSVADRSRSLGVASRAHTPITGAAPMFELAGGELEYGVGIHGERAREVITRPPLTDLVDSMCRDVVAKLPAGAHDVAVLVNGLGSATSLELYSVYGLLRAALDGLGYRVRASIVGTLVAALDMRGFSITLTALTDDWLERLTSPADTVYPWKVITHA
jgi:phosphoenolpyruvate---glycerone phosphotransferase subunit DhaK